MPTTRDRDLPLCLPGQGGLCPAGEGNRLDESRAHRVAFRDQMRTWLLPMRVRAFERRLWRVTIRPALAEKRKIERTLPTGRRIRIFSEGLATDYAHHESGLVEGPLYHLTYLDAEALWRDKEIAVEPACDRIELKEGA